LTANGYKLLVVDIDGTLVGRDGSIPEASKAALKQAREHGLVVSLSTGRTMPACRDILNELELDGHHMFCDGAIVFNPHNREEIFVKPLDKTAVRDAVSFARRHEIHIDFYSADRYFVREETWSAVVHRDFFGVPLTMDDFTDLWEREVLIKGGLVATSNRELALARRFDAEFSDRLHFSWVTTPTYPAVDFINVVAPGVSKGSGLTALVAHLGITTTEVIAIGDGNNDVSLLGTAGLGIAMGNATDRAKAAADYVTGDVERGGLATALERFLFRPRSG